MLAYVLPFGQMTVHPFIEAEKRDGHNAKRTHGGIELRKRTGAATVLRVSGDHFTMMKEHSGDTAAVVRK